jgi:hypothetical protein
MIDMALPAEQRKFWTPEFVLVWTMLLVLLAVVMAIMFIPPRAGDAKEVTFKDVAEYRKTMLSIVVTTFGAWVGAGAAYFFGKENLRVAADSILAMREQSPQERLRHTPIRAVPPKPIDWLVKVDDDLKSVVDKLKAEPKRWFVPVTEADGSLNTLLHEQAIWRFIDKGSGSGTAYADILKQKVSDVIDYIKKTPGLEKDINIYVAVTMEQTAGEAYDLMQSKRVFLAVVLDDKKAPKYYIDTGDVRILMLRTG